MKNFKNIYELYKIEEINEDNVLVNINKKLERVYIYKIEPLLLLDLSEEIQNNVINIYNQFLRECDFNIQILISNKRLDEDKYINNYYKKSDLVGEEIYERYILDMKKKIVKEKIYETKNYLIVSLNVKEGKNIEELEFVIYKLEEIGLKISKVEKEDLKNILYKYLNKA